MGATSDTGFRLQTGMEEDLTRVKKWCKDNRVPYGRLMNQVLRALAQLESLSYQELEGVLLLRIEMPRQINLDNQDNYQQRLRNGQVYSR
jgi:hypothetical protein